jgi:transcriptional regulator with XRE-family HTH domain
MLDNDSEKLIRDIGRRIAEIRTRKGWKQQDLADALQVTWRQVARWEAGSSNFTVATLNKLAKTLGCSVTEFYKIPKTSKPKAGRPPKNKNPKNRPNTK